MNKTVLSKTCGLLFVLASTPSPARAANSIALIPPSSQGVAFQPTHLNDHGTVIGLDSGLPSEPSLIWNGTNTTVIPLGKIAFSSAQSINNNGTTVGYVVDQTQAQYAFAYDGNKVTLLPAPIGQSTANAINAGGVIAGTITVNGKWNTATWTAGKLTDLAPTAGQNSQATAINDNGVVAGAVSSTGDPETNFQAVIWQGTKATRLGDLGGGFSEPLDLNNSNTVVGASQTKSTNQHAFSWQNGTMHDLGVLPGDSTSTATGINDEGEIVGMSTAGPFGTAVLWDGAKMLNLNTLLPKNSGWDLQDAIDINDNRQIIGTGLFNNQPAAFLLNLTPPSTLNATPITLIADPISPIPEPLSAAFLFTMFAALPFTKRYRTAQ